MANKDNAVAVANKKMGLMALIALGVGSMIGGGVFNSPTDLILVANPMTVVIAWCIGGVGVIALALVFQLLSKRRPELTGGIASYAKAGFGDMMGFVSAFGYWISALLGNVAIFTLMIKTLNSLLPEGAQLSGIASFILASIILWIVVWIQTKGSASVGFINLIVTITKLLPLALVIILGLFAWNPHIFHVENWTSVLASAAEPITSTSFFSQINGAMGVILWCFIGVEATTVLAEKAESQKIVGTATVIAIIATLAVYIGISVVSMGVVPAEELAAAETPLADVLSATVISGAGAIIVKLGILISLLGASLSWVMIAAQLPYAAAKEELLPKFFTKTNTNGAPTNALFLTNSICQILFLVLLSNGLQNVYNIVLLLATTCMIIPYLLSSLYAFKVTGQDNLDAKNFIFVLFAVIYTIYCLFAIGIVYLGASFIIYAIGMILFYKTKKDINKPITKGEWTVMLVIFLIGVVMAISLAMGVISI